MNRFLLFLLTIVLLAPSARAVPNLKLPWNSGESWQCTCSYGCGLHTNGNNGYHSVDFDKPGIDEGEGDQPVRAAAPGTVIFTGLNGAYGYCVKIDHGSGYVSMYAHLRYNPTVSGSVQQGQQIGVMGGTGTNGVKAYNDHIHFMVYYNGQCKSSVPQSKPEPMSGYTNFTASQYYTSDNVYNPPTYTCDWVTQSPFAIPLSRGLTATFSVIYKNTGNTTWKGGTTPDTDPDYIELRSCTSTGAVQNGWLYPGSGSGLWISQQRVVKPLEATIPPGQNATFTFVVKVPIGQGLGNDQRAYFRPYHATGGLIGACQQE